MLSVLTNIQLGCSPINHSIGIWGDVFSSLFGPEHMWHNVTNKWSETDSIKKSLVYPHIDSYAPYIHMYFIHNRKKGWTIIDMIYIYIYNYEKMCIYIYIYIYIYKYMTNGQTNRFGGFPPKCSDKSSLRYTWRCSWGH